MRKEEKGRKNKEGRSEYTEDQIKVVMYQSKYIFFSSMVTRLTCLII